MHMVHHAYCRRNDTLCKLTQPWRQQTNTFNGTQLCWYALSVLCTKPCQIVVTRSFPLIAKCLRPLSMSKLYVLCASIKRLIEMHACVRIMCAESMYISSIQISRGTFSCQNDVDRDTDIMYNTMTEVWRFQFLMRCTCCSECHRSNNYLPPITISGAQ